MKRFLFGFTVAVVLGCAAGNTRCLAQPDSSAVQRPKLYLVSNAHLDSQWKWTVRKTISEYLPNTLCQNFALFEKHPEYVFNFEGAVRYAWMKEYYPEQYEKLKEYVENGQWRVAGSLWESSDMIVPSSESLFKNILLGQEFFKTEFGHECNDIMLPDCFGFPYILPTVARHCGIYGFSTQKLKWRYGDFYGDGRKWPFEFGIWEGIDGSRILAVPYGGDYTWNPQSNPREDGPLDSLIQSSPVNVLYRYYGTVSSGRQADRGGSPDPASVEMLCDNLDKDGKFDIILAGSDSIYKDYLHLIDGDALPVYKGELLMDTHGTGCYTAIASMKKLNRENEKLGSAAESISVMADWTGTLPYQKYQINDAYKRFLWHQFHDDLTGTSIPEVYQISWNDEYIAKNQFSNTIKAGLNAVVSNMDTRVKGLPVAVFNPVSGINNSLTEISIPAIPDNKQVRVYRDGEAVKSQIISRDSISTGILIADTSAPLGIQIYDIRQTDRARQENSALKVSEHCIENSIYRIRVDEKGDISSVYDKRCGKELVRNGQAFSIQIFEQNISDEWPAWEIYKATLDSNPVGTEGTASTCIEESGPIRAILRVDRQYHDTRISQKIILTDGASDDRIDIETTVDWREEGKLMKAGFPFSFESQEASYDIGLGSIRRGNNTETAYEVYAQQWADLSADDGSYGVTIITDGKYGWDKPDDNTLRLTLFHSPSANKNRYVSHRWQDHGIHTFQYSIVGHPGQLDAGKASTDADMMSMPKFHMIPERHDGALPDALSFAATSDPELRIKCLKKAENGDGYIIRVYNIGETDIANAEIEFMADIESAEEITGTEDFIREAVHNGRHLSISAIAFSPKTFRVRLKQSPKTSEAPVCQFLDIPYDKIAITSNAFRSIGEMDGKKLSYAAEIMPDTLEHNGIKFLKGTADRKNALSCSGQKIRLPENCAQVFLLAASSDKDRTAVFKVGRDSFLRHVPSWAGNFGQSAMKGMSPAFEKEGDLAYIGTHRHNSTGKDEIYRPTYLFMICIPANGAEYIELPDDKAITILAATALSR